MAYWSYVLNEFMGWITQSTLKNVIGAFVMLILFYAHDRHRVDLHVHAWGARLLATLAAQPSCAGVALQALKPRGAEAAGVEAQEGKTTMLLPRLYAGLQKGLEDTGERD